MGDPNGLTLPKAGVACSPMPLETRDQAGEGTIDDRDYVRSLCDSGDEGGFFALLKGIEPQAMTYARRYLGDVDLAEDALQQANINALRAFRSGTFDAAKRLQPWYFSVLTNAAIDLLRKNDRHRRNTLSIDRPNDVGDEGGTSSLAALLRVDDDPGAAMEEADDARTLQRAFEMLPEHHRRVLSERYVYGNRYRDIAEDLGIPLGTVKSRMHVAVQALGVAFADIVGETRAA